MRAQVLSNEEIQEGIPADWDMLELELFKIDLQSPTPIRNLALKSGIRLPGLIYFREMIKIV